MWERAWSSLSLTAPPEHPASRSRTFAVVVTWCLPCFPTMSLPPSLLWRKRNAGSWQAAKGLQRFRQPLPACSLAVLPSSLPVDVGSTQPEGSERCARAIPSLGPGVSSVGVSISAAWILQSQPAPRESRLFVQPWPQTRKLWDFGPRSERLLRSPLMSKHRKKIPNDFSAFRVLFLNN